jgi:pyruvate formate lyase activating enzyme
VLTKAISSITPFTLLDYPHKAACILWYAGCNMRCLYCYNPEIVLGKGTIAFDAILSFLDKRKGLLDAVVFSGGECTLHKSIYYHIMQVKTLGFLVKIDTNGSKPELLQRLIDENALDYVALDFKALPSKFQYITQSKLYAVFKQSLEILLANTIPFEVRTTYHSELLDEEDIKKMIVFLETHHYVGNYYIQHFRNNTKTLGNLSYSKKNILEKNLSTTTINVVFR